MITLPPLSLYIHVPWCVRKCPYCDFNSHGVGAQAELPEQQYVQALLADLDHDLPWVQGRALSSIFIGGGTPSLLSPQAYEALFAGLHERLTLAEDCEVTLEANPGTVEQQRFEGYRQAGINRLSIGIQSFQPGFLKTLGRIHSGDEATRAVEAARHAGFTNFNIDLMHGLPGQSVAQALDDLQQALALAPTHLSWYQLTLEPNTEFYSRPPVLPEDDALADIQDAGLACLAQAGFEHYEVSAHALPGRQARHNLNYWQFGDYLGIGAGAHGKLSTPPHAASDRFKVIRRWKTRQPAAYLSRLIEGRDFVAGENTLSDTDLPFEFMLNALRLKQGVPASLYPMTTGLNLSAIEPQLSTLRARGLLEASERQLVTTPFGFDWLNEVLLTFSPDDE